MHARKQHLRCSSNRVLVGRYHLHALPHGGRPHLELPRSLPSTHIVFARVMCGGECQDLDNGWA